MPANKLKRMITVSVSKPMVKFLALMFTEMYVRIVFMITGLLNGLIWYVATASIRECQLDQRILQTRFFNFALKFRKVFRLEHAFETNANAAL